MNIFYTDSSPLISAQNLDDLRLNKMIVESAQMLSTAVRYHCWETEGMGIYKMSYINHPCTKWVRENRANFSWLLQHALHMCYLRNNSHKTYGVLLELRGLSHHIPTSEEFTEPPKCNPHKHNPDVVESYQLTMIEKWNNDVKKPTWNYGKKPSWYL